MVLSEAEFHVVLASIVKVSHYRLMRTVTRAKLRPDSYQHAIEGAG